MINPLFNRFGGTYKPNNQTGGINNSGSGIINALRQYRQLQNDPGAILDILLQNGKINQQQYNELQPMRNNPQQIVNYLAQHGNSSQINQAKQMANDLQK